MKRLLLSLCLVGAAFPGHTPFLLQTTQPSTASAALLVGARAPPPISPGGLKAQGMAGSNHSEQMVGRSVAMVRHDTETTLARAEEQRAPLPPTGDRTEPSVAPVPEDEKEEVIWAVVVRWATVHSGPSVSAPTVRFYPVGTELQVVDYQGGWFQVLDAATSQRGWIYEKYYLQPIPGPGQMIAAVSDWSERTPAALEAPKPRPHVKRVKKSESQKRKKIPPRIASARTQRESVANIMDRAIRR